MTLLWEPVDSFSYLFLLSLSLSQAVAPKLGPDSYPLLQTEPSYLTTACSEPSRKALIKTHDFKLSKLSNRERTREKGEEAQQKCLT